MHKDDPVYGLARTKLYHTQKMYGNKRQTKNYFSHYNFYSVRIFCAVSNFILIFKFDDCFYLYSTNNIMCLENKH